MISRTAENCFWLSRNLERAEIITKSVQVNYNYATESQMNIAELWFPLLVVLGEKDRFIAKEGHKVNHKAEQMLEFMVWDESTPSSIYSSMKQARENARIVRDLISYEMWELLNSCWLWLNKPATKKSFYNDPESFCEKMLQFTFTYRGMFHNLILREEPFYFMQMGMLLERANLTVRLMDLSHYHTFNVGKGRESIEESLYWQRLLQRCMSIDAFLRRDYFDINRRQVTEFLLTEPNFPRTVFYCLRISISALEHIAGKSKKKLGAKSTALLVDLHLDLSELNIEEFLSSSHKSITKLVIDLANICRQVEKDFFNVDMQVYGDMLDQSEYIATQV